MCDICRLYIIGGGGELWMCDICRLYIIGGGGELWMCDICRLYIIGGGGCTRKTPMEQEILIKCDEMDKTFPHLWGSLAFQWTFPRSNLYTYLHIDHINSSISEMKAKEVKSWKCWMANKVRFVCNASVEATQSKHDSLRGPHIQLQANIQPLSNLLYFTT